MASLLTQAVGSFLATQLIGKPFHLKAGEIENPSSAHAHVASGPGNSYILLTDNSNFQLFRTPDEVLTFIFSDNNTASYWGGGDRTIYDFGHNNTLRFSENEHAKIDVFGFDKDPTGKVVIYNADLLIQPDGHGGTLVGNIDFHDTALDASRVSFRHVDQSIATSSTELFPLTT